MGRGHTEALCGVVHVLDERVELIKFNLFDNYTYKDYVTGRDGVSGRSLKVWDELRLEPGHPRFQQVGGVGEQICTGELMCCETSSQWPELEKGS